MYRVICDREVLHDIRDEDYQIFSPKISLELNKTGNFDFEILPTHPNAGTIEKLKSRISVYEDSELLFKGRPMNDESDFQNTGLVTCEGELAFLLDTIQRPKNFGRKNTFPPISNNTEIFRIIIAEHNSQVEEEKQFTIGQIDIDSAELENFDANYEKTWDLLQTNFLDKYEGYLRVRYDGNIRYLDYVKQYGRVSDQVIRFGENLLDLKKYSKAEDIRTAIIPVGANNVRINTANGHNGTDYIYSQEAVDLYGWIFDKVDFPDANSPDELLAVSKEYLNSCINLAITIELTAVDLHMVDVDINAIRLGDLVPCVSRGHGLLSTLGDASTYYLVSKYEIDLENPANNTITLGRKLSCLSDKMAENVSIKNDIQVVKINTSNAVQTAESASQTAQEAMNVASNVLAAYPVGSIYLSVSPSNPTNFFGGTWVRWGVGRLIAGVDASQTEFNVVEKTGGEKSHVLSTGEMPPHSHTVSGGACTTSVNGGHTHNVYYRSGAANGEGGKLGTTSNNNGVWDSAAYSGEHAHTVPSHTHSVGSSGSGQAHNNLPPYITCYMWKRTA